MALGVEDAGATAVPLPIADGGDGTLDVLLTDAGSQARVTHHAVTGPLGAPVQARLGWLSADVAVVELAEASGLHLLRAGMLDALAATSRGTGELLLASLAQGARRVIVGVGGSASTDGGAGLLQALGARLLRSAGTPIGPGGAALLQLDSIDLGGIDPRLRAAALDVAVDVRNPLLGPDGAATVFGPQKGASAADVALLERGLARLAAVAERDCGAAGLATMPGSGAAGGCGFGLALAGAHLRPGAALVCDIVRLDAALERAALVLTGEGRLDAQTASGKGPHEVARRARAAGVTCVAIAGQVIDPAGDIFNGALSLDDLAETDDPRRDAATVLRRAARVAVDLYLSRRA